MPHLPCRHFNICLASLLLALTLSACAAGEGGRSRETGLPFPGEHRAFKAMILAQPEFSEAELLKFQKDLAPTMDMTKEEALPYLEANKGWPQARSTYMILKMGMASESILTGRSCAELFSVIPPELYPSPAEIALVSKHGDLVLPLFLPPGSKAAGQDDAADALRPAPRAVPKNEEISPSIGVHP